MSDLTMIPADSFAAVAEDVGVSSDASEDVDHLSGLVYRLASLLAAQAKEGVGLRVPLDHEEWPPEGAYRADVNGDEAFRVELLRGGRGMPSSIEAYEAGRIVAVRTEPGNIAGWRRMAAWLSEMGVEGVLVKIPEAVD